MHRTKRKVFTDNRKIKSIEVTVDGIKFKSKLEAYTYILLKEAGLNFKYEGTTFTLLIDGVYPGVSVELKGRSKRFENSPAYSKISYTPDFVSEEEGWIIECKGHPNERFPLIWKLFKMHMSQVKYKNRKRKHYDLYVPRNSEHVIQTINLIKQRKNEENCCL